MCIAKGLDYFQRTRNIYMVTILFERFAFNINPFTQICEDWGLRTGNWGLFYLRSDTIYCFVLPSVIAIDILLARLLYRVSIYLQAVRNRKPDF